MDNAWKDNLRERFSDYAVPEPEGLWEGIEQGMAGKPRRKRLPVWWLSGGLAAAAAVTLFLLLPGTRRQMPELDRTDAIVLVQPPDRADSAEFSRQPLLAETVVVKKVKEVIPSQPIERIEDETVPDSVPVDATIPEEEGGTEVEIQKKVETVPVIAPQQKTKEKGKKRLSVGVYREGGQEASAESHGFGMAQTGTYLTRATSDGVDSHDLVRLLSANRASSYNARHDAPVRVGVKVSWPMTEHLSLVSGLNWTSLRSEFEETTASTRTLVSQNLGYLGIPLQLEASFKPWKGFRLYAGIGGMVEKGLLATSKTTSYIGDHLEDRLTSHPDTGGLLWSVGTSAGVEYRFSRHIGVYFAPGLEHHFNNGSGIRSAYTEKPLHYNLSLGVRFEFGQ